MRTLVDDLMITPDMGTAAMTLIERLRDATGAEAVALVSVDHARLRCRLDAIWPEGAAGGPANEIPLKTEPLPYLLQQPGPVVLAAGEPGIPWLAKPRPGIMTLSAPLRRRESVTGLLVLHLGENADLELCERTLATAANVGALGLDAVRRDDREEFLAMVRHDIYNPMTVAIFHTEMLGETLEAREDRELADLTQSVLSCLNAVCDLVSNFFYLEAIDEGAPAIHPESIDLTELTLEIVDAHRAMARARDLTLDCEGTCPSLMADRRQLGRVVANLVGNALKYTPGPGAVNVRVAADEHHAILTVQDTGAGMTAENLVRLFDKHARFHQHLGVPGTGLGLYLSKAIVEAHGGTIDATSEPGEGSTFTVRLPRA
jgi:signal transduction histidine kinase